PGAGTRSIDTRAARRPDRSHAATSRRGPAAWLRSVYPHPQLLAQHLNVERLTPHTQIVVQQRERAWQDRRQHDAQERRDHDEDRLQRLVARDAECAAE